MLRYPRLNIFTISFFLSYNVVFFLYI